MQPQPVYLAGTLVSEKQWMGLMMDGGYVLHITKTLIFHRDGFLVPAPWIGIRKKYSYCHISNTPLFGGGI